jgi:23S rRNA (cytidine1920-2'-O)/16S rRNA (cytidine1409-2'-O)-methyltransferase
MPQQRADLLVVSRGLIASRAKAREAIEAGRVYMGATQVTKPAQMLDVDCDLRAEPAYPWVSRAGLKLAAALDAFGLDPSQRQCLDIGASTGGFTQVLLARGARHVVAVDVGRGQLHATLAGDKRVTSLEGHDARTLTRDNLGPNSPDLVVMDVSFIGVEKILPSIMALLNGTFDVVVLVKPQFQAGPARVGKGGIVDPGVADMVAAEVGAQIGALPRLSVLGLIPSPILGSDGNREFLLHARGAPAAMANAHVIA